MSTYKLGALGSLLSKNQEQSDKNKKLQDIFSAVHSKTVVFQPITTYIKPVKKKTSLPPDEQNSYVSNKKFKKKEGETKRKSSKRQHCEIDKDDQDLGSHESPKTKKPKKKHHIAESTGDTETRTIFVGNLPTTITKKILTKIFKKHGIIESIRFRGAAPKTSTISKKLAVIKKKYHDEKTNINAYVRFETVANAEEACSVNGQVLNGYHIRVDMATHDKKHDNKKSVFVGNLPFNVTEEAVYDHFQQCGEVDAVRIIRDSATGAGKGFGYVMFKDMEAVELALLLHERPFEERKIRVMRATNKTKKTERSNRGMPFSKGRHPRKPNKRSAEEAPPHSFQGVRSDDVRNVQVQVKKNIKKKKIKQKKIYFPGINAKT